MDVHASGRLGDGHIVHDLPIVIIIRLLDVFGECDDLFDLADDGALFDDRLGDLFQI